MGYALYYGIHSIMFVFLSIFARYYPFSGIIIGVGECTEVDGEVELSIISLVNTSLYYCYLFCAILALLATTLSFYFSRNYLPIDFAKIGRIPSYAGALLKISILFLTVIHWIVGALVGYFLILSFQARPECMLNDDANTVLPVAMVFLACWVL